MLQTSMQPPTIDDIRAAAQRIEGAVIRTPMMQSRTLSEIIGAEIWLKFENLQFTAAYKERGALNKLLQLTPEERARGVIAASAGNHAQAVAYHGNRLGIPVDHRHAAAHADDQSDADRRPWREGRAARRRCSTMPTPTRASWRASRAIVFVHPFDDPQVIAGQGTVALEMLEDAPELDMIVLPIGGGGLMSGIGIAARVDQAGHRTDRRRGRALSVDEMRDRGRNLPLGGDTLAEGIAVKEPGKLTSRILAGSPTRSCWSPSATSSARWRCSSRIEKTVVEGAGAAGLAAMLADPAALRGQEGRHRPVRRQHRHAPARQRAGPRPCPAGADGAAAIAAQDRPGALAAITAKCPEASVNIIEINHSRIFTRLPAKDTVIEVECEARDPRGDRRRLHPAAKPPDFNVDRAFSD